MSGAVEIWARSVKQVQLLQQQCGRAGPDLQPQEASSMFTPVECPSLLDLSDLQQLLDRKVCSISDMYRESCTP